MGCPLCSLESSRVSQAFTFSSPSHATPFHSDEIIKAVEKNPSVAGAPMAAGVPGANGRPAPVSLRDPGPTPQQQMSQRVPPPGQGNVPQPQNRPPQGYPTARGQGQPPPQGYIPSLGQPRQGVPTRSAPPPQQAEQATRRF